jgi:hypothetical protein
VGNIAIVIIVGRMEAGLMLFNVTSQHYFSYILGEII